MSGSWEKFCWFHVLALGGAASNEECHCFTIQATSAFELKYFFCLQEVWSTLSVAFNHMLV